MTKPSTKKESKPEGQDVFVPVLKGTIKAVDQADVERQVKEALAAEAGDGNN